ncbi:MAG: hypothetical protein ABI538_13940 [Pseudoxanthomonas sp.]
MPILDLRQFLQLATALGATLAWGCAHVRPSSSGWRERGDLYPQVSRRAIPMTTCRHHRLRHRLRRSPQLLGGLRGQGLAARRVRAGRRQLRGRLADFPRLAEANEHNQKKENNPTRGLYIA